jgi:hypothetical protein
MNVLFCEVDMANILEYMKTTLPETSREANPKSRRNAIRKEAREYAEFLVNVQKTANEIGFNEESKKASDDLLFLSKWLLKFGLKDEE